MKDVIKINVPADVAFIIEQLNQAGFEAYAVGGCVRDSVLGREPHDWDITTSALPEEVKGIFRKTIDTGIQHGTVTVMQNHVGYEVTTYRIDGDYQDHRRPDNVIFTRSLEEDLKRRDFTINAMAYNDRTGIVDLFGGIEDLEEKTIRCVGNADERFTEDALRIMRAVRFAAQLGFTIEPETRKAIGNHTKELSFVSAERIETELTKLLTSDHPEMIEELYLTGITKEIIPEIDRMFETTQNTPYHMYDVGHHTVQVLKNVPTKDQGGISLKSMRYAALFHDMGKPECKTTDESGRDHFKGHNLVSEKYAEAILRRLKMDNQTIKEVMHIVYWHDYGLDGGLKQNTLRRALSELGIEYLDAFEAIRTADMRGQSDYKKEWKEANLVDVMSGFRKVIEEKNALKITDLLIKGSDLIELGVPQGKMVGEILKTLMDEVLEDPEMNNRDALLKRAKELLNNV